MLKCTNKKSHLTSAAQLLFSRSLCKDEEERCTCTSLHLMNVRRAAASSIKFLVEEGLIILTGEELLEEITINIALDCIIPFGFTEELLLL